MALRRRAGATAGGRTPRGAPALTQDCRAPCSASVRQLWAPLVLAVSWEGSPLGTLVVAGPLKPRGFGGVLALLPSLSLCVGRLPLQAWRTRTLARSSTTASALPRTRHNIKMPAKAGFPRPAAPVSLGLTPASPQVLARGPGAVAGPSRPLHPAQGQVLVAQLLVEGVQAPLGDASPLAGSTSCCTCTRPAWRSCCRCDACGRSVQPSCGPGALTPDHPSQHQCTRPGCVREDCTGVHTPAQAPRLADEVQELLRAREQSAWLPGAAGQSCSRPVMLPSTSQVSSSVPGSGALSQGQAGCPPARPSSGQQS